MSIVKLLFKFIILIILFIVFAFYYYTIKSKDGFQNTNDTDYHYPHFDISANYYNLTQQEKAVMKKEDDDNVVFDIGNTLGEEIDRNNIPWDSENRSLKPSEVLWGVISREASLNIYIKIFEAEQLARIKEADESSFYFDSALLHYGTADANLGNSLKIADFVANFAGPLIVPMISEKLGGGPDTPVFEWEVYESKVVKQPDFAKNIDSAVIGNKVKIEVMPRMKLKFARVFNKLSSRLGGIAQPKINQFDAIIQKKVRLKKINVLRILPKVVSLYFDFLEFIPAPVGPILNGIYMVVIMPFVMGIALPLIAPKKGSDAIVEVLSANVYASLASMAATALAAIPFPGSIILQAATVAAAAYGALAAFYQQQAAVPAGYKSLMEQMLQQNGHGSGDGKCPNGYVPLDQIWNPTTNLFISFFPLVGDLIDLLYPYLCIRRDATAMNDRGGSFSQLVCIRDPYVLPKYMEQSWISSMFLEWPDYNNRLSTGTNVVGGKLRIVPKELTAQNAGINEQGELAPIPYWSWSGYTNFNDIKNNPNNYYNLNVRLEKSDRISTYEYIGGHKSIGSPIPPNPAFNFFYLDFSDPNILIEMAQFYYNYAIRNPQLGDDKTFTIEYIAKINYVTSSSLFSCDAMCEMISVKYEARSGKVVRETRTYDSDRRFYFRRTPISEGSATCKAVTDIWGNHATLDSDWRIKDDAYDEAMYRLNDAIHFPTDPTEDSTGLISGELLLTAYELYLEQESKSRAAADYIIATNPTFTYTVVPEAAFLTINEAEHKGHTTFQFSWSSPNADTNIDVILKNETTNANLINNYRNSVYPFNSSPTKGIGKNKTGDYMLQYDINYSLTVTVYSNNYTISTTQRYNFRIPSAGGAPETSRGPQIISSNESLRVARTLSQIRDTYNTALNAITLTTAQQANDESNPLPVNIAALENAESNYENALLEVDRFYLDFKMNSDTAKENYIEILSRLYTNNEKPHLFFKNDLYYRNYGVRVTNPDSGINILNDLESRMIAVINAREALWIKHKRDASTNSATTPNANNLRYKYPNDTGFMATKYYDVTACTHIDETGPAAITPDVLSEQSDIRFPCQFDVLPHLKRCENINITLDKCIDLSNIEDIVKAVQRVKPNLRIKTIHSIKARGNNTCQYIWDQYDKATPANIIQTTNRILYQQDVSACTFCLPEGANSATDATIVQKIYVDNTDNKKDDFDQITKTYQVGTTNITTTLNDLTVPEANVNHYFQPLNNYRNTNSKLAFKKATYSKPDTPPAGGEPTTTQEMTNQLYIPRYDINNNFRKMPDLVRPKKPIRLNYPNSTELSLGKTATTNLTNYCSDPVNMSNFMLRYNRTNPSNEMIVNIQRAFTTGLTTCDYEVDVFIKDSIEKDMYDNVITLPGGATPKQILETDIRQIEKIDENGTKVVLTSSNRFFRGMTVDVRYNITDSVTYRLTTSLIVGVGKLTPNIFNPYEINIRTALTPLLSITATNIIVGFDLERYKVSGIIMDFIGIVNTHNTTTNVKSKTIFIVRINNYNNLAVNAPTIYEIQFLNRELSNIGNLTSATGATYVTRNLSITESLAPYDTASSTRTISQAIQGLRVITNVDVSNNIHTITYKNDIDKIPLDIYYTESGSTTLYNRNIPATARNIGKMTLKNIVTRKTVSYDMTSSPPLTEAYQNQNTQFTYDSINAAGDGLEIKRNTPTLRGDYSNTGYNFSEPAKSNIDSKFGPNITYFNDNLITTYTSNVSTLSGKTSDFLRPLVQAIKLSNIVTGVDVCASQPLSNVCSNANYMQRIMDAYNNGNSPIGIFNQERNTMKKIIQASTADGNKCHLIFENMNERFNDITTYDSNNPNNYTVTNTLKFMSFPMDSNATNCDFTPKKILPENVISNNTLSTYPEIRASDFTLSYNNTFPPPYIKPYRTNICQVGDTNDLFTALRTNYTTVVNVAGNVLSNNGLPQKIAWRIVGYDKIDYLLSVTANGGLRKVILRAKFDLANYPTDCSWSYTPGSFKVQVSLTANIVNRTPYTSLTYVEIVDSTLVTGTDNISPLYYHPEF